jgi:hypothetical protein
MSLSVGLTYLKLFANGPGTSSPCFRKHNSEGRPDRVGLTSDDETSSTYRTKQASEGRQERIPRRQIPLGRQKANRQQVHRFDNENENQSQASGT